MRTGRAENSIRGADDDLRAAPCFGRGRKVSVREGSGASV